MRNFEIGRCHDQTLHGGKSEWWSGQRGVIVVQARGEAGARAVHGPGYELHTKDESLERGG